MNFNHLTLLPLLLLLYCSGSDLQRAEKNLSLGDHCRAEKILGTLLDKKPDDARARFLLAKAQLQHLFSEKTDTLYWNRALMNLEAARTLTHDSDIVSHLAIAWAKRAEYLIDNNDTAASLGACVRSISYNPQLSSPLNLAAIIYFSMGQFNKAEQLFLQLLKKDTNSVEAYFNLGMVYWSLKQYDQSYTTLLEAAKRAPSDTTILYFTAQARKRVTP